MSFRMLLLGSTLLASSLAMSGCAHKQPPPADKPAAATPAPAPAATPTPAPETAAATPAPETPPAAPATPAPECTTADDCASKGTPDKGMQWACADSKCTSEKKPAGKHKKKG